MVTQSQKQVVNVTIGELPKKKAKRRKRRAKPKPVIDYPRAVPQPRKYIPTFSELKYRSYNSLYQEDPSKPPVFVPSVKTPVPIPVSISKPVIDTKKTKTPINNEKEMENAIEKTLVEQEIHKETKEERKERKERKKRSDAGILRGEQKKTKEKKAQVLSEIITKHAEMNEKRKHQEEFDRLRKTSESHLSNLYYSDTQPKQAEELPTSTHPSGILPLSKPEHLKEFDRLRSATEKFV